MKKRPREVGMAPCARTVAWYKLMETIPIGFAERQPIAHLDGHAGLAHRTAFTPSLLALVGGEAREEILEVAITRIRPVELEVAAAQQAATFEQLRFGFSGE